MYYSQPQVPNVFQQSFGIKGRPVSSIEEAKAASIDFDGSIFYFPDIANKRIYTKQVNMDGTSTLNVYEYKDMPVPQYVTREEFNQLKEMIQQKKEPTSQDMKSSQASPPQFNF